MKPLNLVTYLFLFPGLCACDSASDMSPKSGKEYEIVVIMNHIAWDGISGSLIREQFSMPVPFLQQAEPSMNIKYVIPEQINDSIKYARNILIVGIDKTQYPTISFKKKTDKWSDEQVIIYLNAPDEQSLEAFLTENHNFLVDIFMHDEINRAKRKLLKTHSNTVLEMVKKYFDITLYAPADIVSYKDTTDCIWFSNNTAFGRTDLLVFSFPFENRESLSFKNLINKRDSITKIMIPGFKQGTYKTTDRNNVNYSTTTLNGKYCVIIRGLWHLHGNESIAGPFVCYARTDEPNSRIIVAEGFVYEPVSENRNYIGNMEATLQTIRFPDEQEEN
ncbi:MAG: DUF4837 family protein [Tannerella sp.]|nr:DUF4837 family protein [Tannerella sp.]